MSTWPEVFERRLRDGTAWTTGWTQAEVDLPLNEEKPNAEEGESST